MAWTVEKNQVFGMAATQAWHLHHLTDVAITFFPFDFRPHAHAPLETSPHTDVLEVAWGVKKFKFSHGGNLAVALACAHRFGPIFFSFSH